MATRELRSVAAFAALLGSASVDAQPLSDARRAYELGTRELEAHRYPTAIEALEASFRLDPVPVVLFNLGLAHEGVGHVRAAIDSYERYLSLAREVPAARAEALRARVATLRASLCTLAVEGDLAGATLRVDGRDEPLVDGVARIEPGERVVELDAPGRVSLRQTLPLTPGSRTSLRLEVAPPPTSPPPAPRVEPPPPRVDRAPTPATPHPRATPAPSIASRWWFWTLLGAVVVAGVATGLAVGLHHTEAPIAGTSVDVETLRVRPPAP